MWKKECAGQQPFCKALQQSCLRQGWISYLHPMTIAELENWFNTNPMPPEPVMLNPATRINDIQHFLQSHFYPLKLDPANKINLPLLDRLLDFKLLIESNL